MSLFRVAVLCAAIALSRLAGATDRDGTLLGNEPVVFPAYADALVSAYHGRPGDLPAADYTRTVEDRELACRRLTYASDGLRVVAYAVLPQDGKPRPVIVFNRGSWKHGEIGPSLFPFLAGLARQGFTVVAPMYRGSAGAAGTDEMGGADVNDLLNVVPLLRALPAADVRQLYLYGESRGGMMVFQALRDGFPARAAATWGAFADAQAMVEAHPERYRGLIRTLWPDFDTRKDEILARRSAVRWAERLTVPLLLMHGGADTSIDVSQARALAARLRHLKRPVELHVFEGDDHVIRGHRRERDARAIAWFRAHAK